MVDRRLDEWDPASIRRLDSEVRRMLKIILIIVIYILGPAFVLAWVVRRYRSGIKPNFAELILVVAAIGLIGLLAWAYSGSVSDRDGAEVLDVVSTLTQRYSFPLKSRFQDRPAVDGVASARHLEIRIYGVESRDEQAKIIKILEKLRREISSKPLLVNFFKQEEWELDPDGARRPLRDEEQLLNKARIP